MKPNGCPLPIIRLLLIAGFFLQSALAGEVPVTHGRLVLVCANLGNAAALVAGGVATSVEEESKRLTALSDAALRRKIFKLVDIIEASVTTAPRASRPDIFAFSRDARLALIDNRAEPFSGHRQYILDHPKRAQAAIIESVEDIKKALMQLKISER